MSLLFNALNVASTRIYWPSNDNNRGGSISGEWKTVYGQRFFFRSFHDGKGRHIDAETLERVYRHRGDPIVDRIMDLRHQEGRPLGAAQDLIARGLLRDDSASAAQSDQALADFLRHYAQLPSWVDVEALRRGQKVYLLYTPVISLSHYYRSLVPGFSIPKIAAVLKATAYLTPPSTFEQVQRRLMDTGAFLAACAALPAEELTRRGGAAWTAALQVRVLHAKVRRALLQRKGPKRVWNTSALGIPINQEDMAATLTAFAQNALVGCEIILGRPLPLQERLDYLHLWRYVGWLLGVDVYDLISYNDDNQPQQQQQQHKPIDPCGPGWYHDRPDVLHHSVATAESMLLHLMTPDRGSSVKVAHHLLRLGRRSSSIFSNDSNRKHDNQNQQSSSSSSSMLMSEEDATYFTPETMFSFRALQCRRFVGDPLADALELPLYPAWSWKRVRLSLVAELYAWVLRIYTRLGQLPFLRQRWMQRHQRLFLNFWERWQAEQQQQRAAADKISETTTTTSRNGASTGGGCPYAMVMPPIH